MSHPEDNEIIELYFARDERAIVETAVKYEALCLHTAMRILNNKSDAEECVNDTWLGAWNRIPPERPQRLAAFLCRITRNISISRWRANHRIKCNPELTVAFHELSEVLASPEESDGMLKELLVSFVRNLGDLDKKLFVGRYFHLYTVESLAVDHGMTPNAVSLRLMRTREKLRDYLTKEGYTL